MAEYIEREAICYQLEKQESIDGQPRAIRRARRIVADFPAADVRPVVHGRWIWNPNGMDWGLGAWCCSECKSKAETWWANDRKYNPLHCSGGHFCGNCGAKMDKDGDDE